MLLGLATVVVVASGSGLGPLYVEPEATYAPLYTLLRSAKHSLDLTMYELQDPQVEQALVADAQRKVTVRVLLDKAFHGQAVNQPAFTRLQNAGVAVHWASTKVTITHQKSFVIDNKKSVVMTGNFTQQYYATARDFSVVDTRKPDVAAIEQTFTLDWANTKGVAPPGTDLVWSPGSQAPLVTLLDSAKRTLLVENEELQSPAIVDALAAAAHRGVDVRLLLTDQPTWHSNFNTLKTAGVHVRTYKSGKHLLYIHAKTIVVDGRRVFLGSENFSKTSLQTNRELGLVTSTKSVVQGVQGTFEKDFGAATPW